MRTPLSKEGRSKLRAECPRPSVPGSACKTPEVDPQIAQFLNKSDWKPKKGLDFSLKSCQDKIMDTSGPLSKAYELLESAKSDEAELDLDVAIGWIQRAICLIGNANMAVSAERRKAILLKIDPKLATMAISEPGPSAEGMFGDNFIKDLGSYVKTFTTIDKARANMKRFLEGLGTTGAVHPAVVSEARFGHKGAPSSLLEPSKSQDRLHSSHPGGGHGIPAIREGPRQADALIVSTPVSPYVQERVAGRLAKFLSPGNYLSLETRKN
ncbi:Hypothetical predicted protein [Pelobates cultripes]|uniref:Uncharacterized protein n=1 Tax=Pelobates cultripes TaxID=61616 RepID=A0AAD1SHN7_PELCU|nr:Hypothetical predicted protein [Pelobates cultripes]